MLLVNGLHFHCVKSLNSSQCSFYFSKKISQNTRSLFNLLHEVIVYYFQIFHLHQRVVMFHRFLRLETTSKSFLRNTFSKTDPFKSFPRVKEIVYSWVFLRSECFFLKFLLLPNEHRNYLDVLVLSIKYSDQINAGNIYY